MAQKQMEDFDESKGGMYFTEGLGLIVLYVDDACLLEMKESGRGVREGTEVHGEH